MEVLIHNNNIYNMTGDIITHFPENLNILTIDGMYNNGMSNYLFDFLPESLKELRLINCEISQKFIDNLPISLKKIFICKCIFSEVTINFPAQIEELYLDNYISVLPKFSNNLKKLGFEYNSSFCDKRYKIFDGNQLEKIYMLYPRFDHHVLNLLEYEPPRYTIEYLKKFKDNDFLNKQYYHNKYKTNRDIVITLFRN